MKASTGCKRGKYKGDFLNKGDYPKATVDFKTCSVALQNYDAIRFRCFCQNASFVLRSIFVLFFCQYIYDHPIILKLTLYY